MAAFYGMVGVVGPVVYFGSELAQPPTHSNTDMPFLEGSDGHHGDAVTQLGEPEA